MENINSECVNEIDVGIRKPSISQVGILYSVTVIVFILLGNLIDKIKIGDFYLKGIASEILLVLFPPLIMLLIFRYDFKKILRLNKISFFNIFIIFFIMLFALPAVGALNFVNLLAIKCIFGKTMTSSIPQMANWVDLIKAVIVIGISAAVCEEVFFRGVIQRGFERFGAVKSILMTAFLFGLMHQDFQKLLGTFLLGALIGFIVYRTDSLYGGMAAHFSNNFISVVLTFGLGKLSHLIKSTGLKEAATETDMDKYLSQLLNGPKIELLSVIIVWGVIFLIFIAAFAAVMYAFVKNTSKIERNVVQEKGCRKSGLLWLLPGVCLIGFIYFAEGLKLKGISIEAVTAILRFMGY